MKKTSIAALILSLVALLVGAAALTLFLVTPAPEPTPPDLGIQSEGDTNFTNVVASGDLTAGDDLTVGDDATVTDALTAADLTASDDVVVGDDLTVTDDATVTGAVLLDATGNAVHLTVQEYTTPTNAALVVEDSGGTDVAAFSVAPVAAGSFDLLDLTDTMAIQDGTDTVIGIDLNLTGANHTGSSNYVYGLDIDLTTADAQAEEVAIELTDTDWDTGIKSVLDLEHILLPSVSYATIITSTDGALWTVGASEVWFIHAVYCHVTTNFDCDGDDCTVDIGTGDDANGFLDLDDAELQTSDTEGTGAPAGWQGFMSTDTIGAYLTNGLGFILGNDTIDVAVDDTGGTDPSAGAATCYIVYTRLQ